MPYRLGTDDFMCILVCSIGNFASNYIIKRKSERNTRIIIFREKRKIHIQTRIYENIYSDEWDIVWQIISKVDIYG